MESYLIRVGQPTACMPQVVWAASVHGMQQIEEGAESRARVQAGEGESGWLLGRAWSLPHVTSN